MRVILTLSILLLATPALSETWYAQRVSQTGGGIGIEHLWSNGASMRSELVVNARPVTTVVHGKRYWVIDRMSGKGVSIARHPNAVRADSATKRPFGDEGDRLQQRGGEFVRSEKLGPDVACKLYKLTDDAGRQEVCVGDDENKLPVYILSWDRRTKREGRLSYMNWLRGLEIAPGFFNPGKGAEIKTFTYEAFVKASDAGAVGPAPILYPHLLHGDREQ